MKNIFNWIRKLPKRTVFLLIPEMDKMLQFLDPEIFDKVNFLDPEIEEIDIVALTLGLS